MPAQTGPESYDLSVVVPVFDGAAQVGSAVSVLRSGILPLVPSLEIVLVDDGSTDDTGAQMERAAAATPGVRVVRLARNTGKGAAVTAGMLAARGHVRVFTDVDVPFGTEPVVAIARRIAAGEADVVVGDRLHPDSTYFARVTPVRRAASWAFMNLVRLLAPGDSLDTQCGLKGFSGEVASHLFPLLREPRFAFDAEILFLCRRHGLRVARAPVSLVRSGPSTVSVTRVALPMLRSVASLRGRWRAGVYRSEWFDARRRAGPAPR